MPETYEEMVARCKAKRREYYQRRTSTSLGKILHTERTQRCQYKKLGITIDQVHIMRARGCDICNKLGIVLSTRIQIDHDHKTGLVRGALCQVHNTTLGNIRDDIQHLRALETYLLNPPGIEGRNGS